MSRRKLGHVELDILAELAAASWGRTCAEIEDVLGCSWPRHPLASLVRKGLAISERDPLHTGAGRPRLIWRITPRGRAALRHRLDAGRHPGVPKRRTVAA